MEVFGCMARLSVWGLILLLGCFLCSGCGTAQSRKHSARKTTASAPAKSQPEWPAEKIAQAHAHYAAAVIHEMNDEGAAALDEYFLAAMNDPENEDLVLEISRRFVQRKQLDKALDLLSLAASRPNVSGPIFARLGLVYAQLGKIDQAINADRLAIRKSPAFIGGYQNLFVTLSQNKRQLEALKVLGEAGTQTNVAPDFLIGLAELYGNSILQAPSQKANIQERMAAVLARAEKQSPADPMLRLRMAELHSLLGEGGKAAQIYLELLKKLPDVPVVREQLHAKLAGIYLRDSNRTNAIEQLQAIVRDDPTNTQAYFYLGFLMYSDKRAAEAVDYFNKAILLNPEMSEAYYNLALAQLNLNQSGDALATLDSARKKFPENFLLDFYSGMACGEQKDYKAALRYFTAAEVMAKATEPKLLDKEFYFQIGACYERTGDYQHAEEYFEKCLQLSPDWPEACNYLGYMWADRGEKLDRARELIEKAVKAEPKNAAYLDSLGWVLFKLKQPDDALRRVLQAIELSPKPDPTVYDHLGDIYAALSQLEKARDAWQKSLSLEPNEQVKKKLDEAAQR
jgi:tetratricopeptide (TPR) repeat protein